MGVAPGSAYHAHWSAECALQAHAANVAKADLERRVRYAQRWNMVCHGKEVFQFLMKRHGWPEKLCTMAKELASDETSGSAGDAVADDVPGASPTTPPPPTTSPTPAPAASSNQWDFTVVEGSSGLTVSIVLPTDT